MSIDFMRCTFFDLLKIFIWSAFSCKQANHLKYLERVCAHESQMDIC